MIYLEVIIALFYWKLKIKLKFCATKKHSPMEVPTTYVKTKTKEQIKTKKTK